MQIDFKNQVVLFLVSYFRSQKIFLDGLYFQERQFWGCKMTSTYSSLKGILSSSKNNDKTFEYNFLKIQRHTNTKKEQLIPAEKN